MHVIKRNLCKYFILEQLDEFALCRRVDAIFVEVDVLVCVLVVEVELREVSREDEAGVGEGFVGLRQPQVDLALQSLNTRINIG